MQEFISQSMMAKELGLPVSSLYYKLYRWRISPSATCKVSESRELALYTPEDVEKIKARISKGL